MATEANVRHTLVPLKPTNKHGTKTSYPKFRKALRDDGFVMVAPELYMRVVANRKAIRKHLKRMAEKLPETDTVVTLSLTEKQWEKMVYLVGEKSDQELLVGGKSHVIL
ncbi:CRISPR-associated endoribonuclease Cas2 [Slackia heliotrinireducens]|nr:CRISPR-associated endoribonuclease Cas2 [Slackia heliotrinireducens]